MTSFIHALYEIMNASAIPYSCTIEEICEIFKEYYILNCEMKVDKVHIISTEKDGGKQIILG